MMTDSAGNKIGEQGHFPYGEQWYAANTTTKWLFNTYERDAESNNDYAMARYFDSGLGRFETPDPLSGSPLDPQSLDHYTYVGSDPVNGSDPTGLFNPVLTNFGGLGGGGFFTCFYSSSITCGDNEFNEFSMLMPQPSANNGDFDWVQRNADLSWLDFNSADPLAGLVPGFQPPPTTSKHYGLTTPCSSTASQVMGAVESNFPQFGNYSRWDGLESVTFSPPAGIGVGSTIPISVGIFGTTQNLSVTVQSMNAQSMTFTTNPGHLLYPAYITFAASSASPGSVNFNINLGGTIASPMEFSFGAAPLKMHSGTTS